VIAPEQVAEVLEELRPYFTTVVEAQLKDYGESANAGCWVSLRLPSPEDLEPFRGQDRSGRNARQGKRYTLMLIALDDHDQHEHHRDAPRKLSQIAGAVGEGDEFQAWAREVHGAHCDSPEQAADFIRSVCGIDSRAELDTNPEAARVFRDLLREFDAWKAGE
jgi:hypothetical protein